MKVYIKGKSITLTQRDYVAEGGEGKVYAKGKVGYKIYHDPAKMLPTGKIKELQAITNPNIIRPMDIITDGNNTPVGYTMRFISDAWSLCQVFPKAFRDRNNVTHDMIQVMISELRQLIEDVHKANILIVDGNEMNFLLTKDFKVVLAIDADSYQTPSYPATAIMLSIRDWKVQHNKWHTGSDWYSFACVTFQMFTGIHPFKGKHPSIKSMEDRMKANVSVFDSKVKIPKIAYDFSVIPPSYLDWYKRIFVKNERCAPPDAQGVVKVNISKPIQLSGNGNVSTTMIEEYKNRVVKYWVNNNSITTVTSDGLWTSKRPLGNINGNIKGCGYTLSGIPVIASVVGRNLKLTELNTQKDIPFALLIDDVVSSNGRIYVKSADHVYEVKFIEAGNMIIASPQIVANVMPNSSHLYPGVIMQNMIGSAFVSLLTQSGMSHQLRVPELDKYRVLDAKFDSGVLMVVGEHKGKYDRFIIRFDDRYSVYTIREIKDIQPTGLNFVTLDTGICVSITEECKIELFSKKKDSHQLKEVDDPIVPGDAILNKMNGTVLFAHDNKIFSMKLLK